MPPSNATSLAPVTFILTGIPGMEQLHGWISVPFCCLYVAALLANGALLATIWAERSLHQPMYLLLCLLALADLTLATTAVPKALALFWFRAGEISFAACLTQMFFLHFTCLAESLILLAMALDRFVATCFPLRYGAVLTPRAVAAAGLAAALRGFCIILPCALLLRRRLRFCGARSIAHTYCEHMGIARLACGLALPFAAGALHLLLLAVSYAFILRAVARWAERPETRALNTCTSHTCAVLCCVISSIALIKAHKFLKNPSPTAGILMANICCWSHRDESSCAQSKHQVSAGPAGKQR
uniref:G-protein coupled receptors family 1 profile domain-containing protein n=1 Tax=Ficedula albicollis TaxID=59894 RepID=U3K066_FICAL